MRSAAFLSRRDVMKAAVACSAAMVAGCGRPEAGAGDVSSVSIVVGRSKESSAYYFMEDAKVAPPPYTVKYADLAGGSPTLSAFLAGALDYTRMSDIPALISIQADMPLRIVAAFTANQSNTGIVVREGVRARDMTDLRGKRVTYVPSTNAHYNLLKILDHHGMTMADIVPVPLPVSDANGAFLGGAVDARCCGSLVALFTQYKLHGRWLLKGLEGICHSSHLIVAHEAALGDSLKRTAIRDYLEREIETWLWIERNPARWARKAAGLMGVPEALLVDLARDRTQSDAHRIPDGEAIAIQENVVSDLQRYKMISKKISPREIWSP